MYSLDFYFWLSSTVAKQHSLNDFSFLKVGICFKRQHKITIQFVLERTSLVAQMVKRLSTMQETWVQSLGWEDPLDKEMAIHSSTIAWEISWTEKPGRLQSMGSQRVGHD